MNINSMPLDDYFKQHWQAFLATYGGLRLFSEQLPELADKLDKQVIEEIVEVMADVFGDPPDQVRVELLEFFPALDEDHLYPDFYNQPDVRETFAAFRDTGFRRRVMKWARENLRRTHIFLSAWADCMARPPLSGIVLRQSALINLVSSLEIFVDGILRGYELYCSPTQETVEFRSWKKRWDKLAVVIPSSLWQVYRAELEEIIARRNVLVHQGGKIDSDYLKFAPKTYQPEKAQEGRFILVPTCYLEKAFNVVILFAFALSQVAWRTWKQPNHSKQADKTVNDFLYQLLRQKSYALVDSFGEITNQLRLGWSYRQYTLVNWSIACREQGDLTKMKALLFSLERRKKRRWEIEIALNILHQHYDKAYELMRTAAQKGNLHQISPYWPLFEPIRGESRFQNVFDVKYGVLPKVK